MSSTRHGRNGAATESLFEDLCSCFTVSDLYARLQDDTSNMFGWATGMRQNSDDAGGGQDNPSIPFVVNAEEMSRNGADLNETALTNSSTDQSGTESDVTPTAATCHASSNTVVPDNSVLLTAVKPDVTNDKSSDAIESGICFVCCDRPETHYCMPCEHLICKVCISRWQDDGHKNCMMCNQLIQDVKRLNVSTQLYESSHTRLLDEATCSGLVVLLDAGLYNAVHPWLNLKDGVTQVQRELDGALQHISALVQRVSNGSSSAIDEMSSVVRVEASSLNDTLGKLLAVVARGGSQTESRTSNNWLKVSTALEELHLVLDKVGALLDAHSSKPVAVKDLKLLVRVLADGEMVNQQWALVKGALESCVNERLPRVLQSLAYTSVHVPGVVSIVHRFGSVQTEVLSRIDESDVAVVMLQSAFEAHLARANVLIG